MGGGDVGSVWQKLAELPESDVVCDGDADWHVFVPSIAWKCESHAMSLHANNGAARNALPNIPWGVIPPNLACGPQHAWGGAAPRYPEHTFLQSREDHLSCGCVAMPACLALHSPR